MRTGEQTSNIVITKCRFEKIAEREHEQWAQWTEYMLNNLTKENIARWREQIKTSYNDLSEEEKESDRVWARIVISELGLTPP